MISLEITSMKNFMSRLLASDAFDCFLLKEAVIGTANTFTIDGRIHREFYRGESDRDAGNVPAADPDADQHEFRPWSEMRGLCFDLIKGRHTPLFFRFVLHLMSGKAASLLAGEECGTDPSLIRALVLNIRYDGSRAVLTTAVSYETFVPMKEADAIWDRALMRYLSARSIEYEIL